MKKFFFLILLCIFSFSFFAQEVAEELPAEELPAETLEDDFNIKGEEFHESETFLDFIHSLDFVMQFEPGMYMNFHKTDSDGKLISAPSPIIYPITIGVLWPNYTFIAVQPSLSFFVMQHLYYDGMALPAEIENRTASTLSFMVNIPVVVSLFIGESRYQLSGGIGSLLRFGTLSAGVNEEDYGYSGSAEKDVELINESFWKDMNWLYLTTGVSWLYNINKQLRLGPTFNAYIPIGAMIGDQDFQGLMFSIGVKICR